MTESRKTRRHPDQEQAISLLKRARDLLMQRLTDALLELGDDLLEDAQGDSFAGEIDSLHERLGLRLNQINALLAGMSADDDPDEADDSRRQVGQKILRIDKGEARDQHEPTPYSARGQGRSTDSEGSVAQQTAVETYAVPTRYPASTYPLFVQDIVRRELSAAGRRLAEVLGTTQNQGEVYATRFRDQLDRDPAFLAKVHSLRQALQSERENEARLLLRECFGLQGLECQAAMELLRGWL